MKNETIASDIRATLAARDSDNLALHDAQRVTAAIEAGANQYPALERAIASRNASLAAQSDLKRIPAPRRALAASIVPAAERIAETAARRCGEMYSGTTTYHTAWGEKPNAHTVTGTGDQYSRGCTFKKTDAVHTVTLDPAGVSLLVENEALRSLSARDGLHLIALYPDNSAVWVRSHRKSIISESGWIAWTGQDCHHSTVSLSHAQAGLAKKTKARLAELREQRKNHKEARRARLVARLCGSLSATIADARAMGFCEPGIAAFRSRFGIGESATLPELVRTGDPSAMHLALRIAREFAQAIRECSDMAEPNNAAVVSHLNSLEPFKCFQCGKLFSWGYVRRPGFARAGEPICMDCLQRRDHETVMRYFQAMPIP